ncbi:alpha/beta fold hydrolase [Cohnella cholangitidis]|uniref:Alpha/beta fold hydrolase n=1 Tax=Cohnella cholangitidis TaxID=2598458 RepID=A0A7G5BXE8_9BACL|nr:alpha/beta fold hydrolase [Cohnella cholangitidis]QMV41632.1 alpha/beta fold hydrolase [Cohnella cholangitidis]
MKKLTMFALASSLLLSSFPLQASASAFKLTIDNKPVILPDAQPYAKGNDIMIPVRHAAQALGLETKLDNNTRMVQLTKPSIKITFKLEENKATISEGTIVPFGTAAVVKNNRVYVPLSFFEKVLGMQTSYNKQRSEAAIASPQGVEATIQAIVKQLAAGDYQSLSDDYFDDSVKQALPVEALKAGWEQTVSAAGSFVGIQSIQSNPNVTKHKEIGVLLGFSKNNVVLSLNLNDNNKIIGLWLKPVQTVVPLPSNLTEDEVIIGEGTAYPLPGTLTLPKDAKGPVPAVVLVHGSGPNDRDETVGTYKPFRDIAWGLAQQGIAVLRYDKRTFTHGKSFTPDMLAKFTVKDETVDDAIAASNLLKSDKRIDASHVYIAGHSLGGLLAPRIDAEGGDFAGLIILAGSTRPLWEISADQNADYIQAMDDKDPAKKTNEAWLAAELEKARNIRNLSDSEAMAQVVFGMPAYYLKEMDAHGAADLVSKLVKPIFVLQGEEDVQVYADKDYSLLKEQLKGNANATFKLYPGLNHFFMNVSGSSGNVDKQVVQDIAEWINKN